MNRTPSATWVTCLRWGLVFAVVLPAVYFGSYCWLRHTESGKPVHEWFSNELPSGKGAAPRNVQSAYAKLYTPALKAERAWRIATFGRALTGTWESEDGSVHLRFDGARVVELRGLADRGVPDGTTFTGTGLCIDSLYLRAEGVSSYMTIPPESIERDACVVRIAARGKSPNVNLRRVPTPR